MDDNTIKLIKVFAQLTPPTAFSTKFYEEFREAPRKEKEMMEFISKEIKREVENVKKLNQQGLN